MIVKVTFFFPLDFDSNNNNVLIKPVLRNIHSKIKYLLAHHA